MAESMNQNFCGLSFLFFWWKWACALVSYSVNVSILKTVIAQNIFRYICWAFLPLLFSQCSVNEDRKQSGRKRGVGPGKATCQSANHKAIGSDIFSYF